MQEIDNDFQVDTANKEHLKPYSRHNNVVHDGNNNNHLFKNETNLNTDVTNVTSLGSPQKNYGLPNSNFRLNDIKQFGNNSIKTNNSTLTTKKNLNVKADREMLAGPEKTVLPTLLYKTPDPKQSITKNNKNSILPTLARGVEQTYSRKHMINKNNDNIENHLSKVKAKPNRPFSRTLENFSLVEVYIPTHITTNVPSSMLTLEHDTQVSNPMAASEQFKKNQNLKEETENFAEKKSRIVTPTLTYQPPRNSFSGESNKKNHSKSVNDATGIKKSENDIRAPIQSNITYTAPSEFYKVPEFRVNRTTSKSSIPHNTQNTPNIISSTYSKIANDSAYFKPEFLAHIDENTANLIIGCGHYGSPCSIDLTGKHLVPYVFRSKNKLPKKVEINSFNIGNMRNMQLLGLENKHVMLDNSNRKPKNNKERISFRTKQSKTTNNSRKTKHFNIEQMIAPPATEYEPLPPSKTDNLLHTTTR